MTTPNDPDATTATTAYPPRRANPLEGRPILTLLLQAFIAALPMLLQALTHIPVPTPPPPKQPN